MSKNTQKRAKQTDAGVDGDTTDRNLAQSETKIVFENETGEEKKKLCEDRGKHTQTAKRRKKLHKRRNKRLRMTISSALTPPHRRSLFVEFPSRFRRECYGNR